MKMLMCLKRLANVAKITLVAGVLMTFNRLAAQDTTAKSQSDAVEKRMLTGTITDASTKKPIVGASVSVSDFSATITDDKGAYKLHVPNYSEEVLISAEGYQVKQVALSQRQTLDISLQDANTPSFQENITMPLSVLPRRELTASATSYDQKGEWKRPMETIDALLQGQVAGQNRKRHGYILLE